jgi:hypothetical protein
MGLVHSSRRCSPAPSGVLWDASYNPTTWIRPVPPSTKWLDNNTPHTSNGPTTPGYRGGATHLKGTKLRSGPCDIRPGGLPVPGRWSRPPSIEGAMLCGAPPGRTYPQAPRAICRKFLTFNMHNRHNHPCGRKVLSNKGRFLFTNPSS